jgi:mono/diheme cytochrome c family protein
MWYSDMKECRWLFLFLWFFLFNSFDAWSQEPGDDLAKKGQYIFSLAGGCACHTVPKGDFNVGARAFPIPFGKVYSTNITQDKETGLGNWTDHQIREALIKGRRPDGRRIIPVMPSEAYSGMAQEDILALVAYLRTLKAVPKLTPQLETLAPFVRSIGIPLYLKFFARFSNPPVQAPISGVERGRYLVEHVSLCGDCHTPRNFIGVPNRDLYLAGAAAKGNPLGVDVPNITPDKATGIGNWKREDIAELLHTGIKPDFDIVQGLMAEVIQGAPHGFKDMRREDALAVADYLKSIPSLKNKIK